jgi:hypothetical protein
MLKQVIAVTLSRRSPEFIVHLQNGQHDYRYTLPRERAYERERIINVLVHAHAAAGVA